MKAHVDFETRSLCDLRTAGQWKYAEHASTEVLCMGWCIGDAPVQCWEPMDGLAPLAPLLAHIAKGGTVGAHNAAFELAVWHHVMPRYGVTVPLHARQMDCTMARAQVMALPAGLSELANVLALGVEKDATGNRLMMLMTKPAPRPLKKGVVQWYDDRERMDRLKAYCVQDVTVERAADKKLPPLPQSTRALWLLDQTINQRGVLLDLPAVASARRIVEAETALCNVELARLTDGNVLTVTNSGALQTWLRSVGVDAPDTTKATVTDLLRSPTLPPVARRVLELRQENGKASTKKLAAMTNAASDDGRARGMFAFHGAATGRWAGRRIQLQNMPRPELKQGVIDEIFETLGRPEALALVDNYGPPVKVISNCLRGMLVPAPGHEFIVADFANIEGRVLAWLAGKAWKVAAFRDYDAGIGHDLYKLSYARSFGVPIDTVTDEQRQIGKVQELALGYGGGPGAFASMAANYGITVLEPNMIAPAGAKHVLTHEDVQTIKHGWRDAHPAICAFWGELESCAMQAVRHPGDIFKTRNGKIKYTVLKNVLLCQLPSKRTIAYCGAHIATKLNPWTGRSNPALKYHAAIGKHWLISDVYGGLLAENVTQAAAADILADALFRAEAADMPVVMHVHDEIITEVVRGMRDVSELENIMIASEPWAAGLPVAAKGWVGNRYQK